MRRAPVLTDRFGNLLWANAATFDRAGSDPLRLKGRPLLSLIERSHRRVALGALARARRGRAVARSGPVLVADDEEMVRMSLATALRSAGLEVVEAKNGLEVAERVLAAPDRFALVVLDLVMPVMDGREALRRLRECAPTLPVVICTGYDPSGGEILTAAAVLIKPLNIGELLDEVAEFTGQPPADGGNGGNLTQ